MMDGDELRRYEFSFPPEAIAQTPACPRDAARLLVFNRRSKKISWDIFANLDRYLPSGSVLVLNQTKVIPAKLEVEKPTLGKARILYLSSKGREVQVLSDRKLSPGHELSVAGKKTFRVLSRSDGGYNLKILRKTISPLRIFELYGQTPIPPYVKHSPLGESDLREQYQTIFAKKKGSVAAPTASLHFTRKLLNQIRKAGHEIRYVTLHVNLGTFAPVTLASISENRLHSEWYEIPKATARALNSAKAKGHAIVAVGTTVARTLETATDESGRLRRLRGETDLFIREGYSFKFVDSLITNFHVPRSSLLMLVSAFLGRKKTLALYRQAIQRKFRLFSFGDGMFLY